MDQRGVPQTIYVVVDIPRYVVAKLAGLNSLIDSYQGSGCWHGNRPLLNTAYRK
ncbi:predicted protein [Botrytis cinerea T4]|uniref:Uncharacterized protein n=1 Tax=Botryotinia fuckeliana (strain T4) TaxID=999810 RepID=G2YVQ7_BOTF4|nr:predicted protein [Botrytis cinerea T4]